MKRIGQAFKRFNIPEKNIDPASPKQQTAWILNDGSFSFSYRTKTNTTIRLDLT